ncbi:(4Fe-4S)-binding protein [Virgibacillus byunsanensis]|uniref:(4Fe-4S)-binding protein n=1 Tax=Virgibacillus byunsanensis TaxID=570945 RepID=A0ABW3LPY0_9BACI
MNNELKNYTGEDIDVQFHKERCIHAAECVNGLPEVFDVKEKPWINADGAFADKVAEIVERCPSGALEYVRKDGGVHETPPHKTIIDYRENYVMYVKGDLEIKKGDEEINAIRASLCGCGHSHNKPFCDESYECES